MFSTRVANAQCLRAFARHTANNAYLSKVDFAKLTENLIFTENIDRR